MELAEASAAPSGEPPPWAHHLAPLFFAGWAGCAPTLHRTHGRLLVRVFSLEVTGLYGHEAVLL